ncbi:MAG: hypothetical protein A2Z12_03310 [Actinobacteria bacterium RBG_16_68_21]|nr:MAG: hypothetical protein A2Z12_03310 [Actinobacteria bacterium RBG_16_68_21]
MASGLTRILDPRLPSNRFILGLTPLAGAIAVLVAHLSGESFGGAVRVGLSAGGVAFLSWAIGREIDPDHPLAACLAAVGAPAFLVLGTPDLLGAALILMAARLVAGTTGRSPIPVDAVVLVVAAGLVASRPVGPPLVAVTAVAMVVAAAVDPPARRVLLVIVAAAAMAGAMASWLADTGPVAFAVPGGAARAVLIAGSLTGGLSVLLLRRVQAPTDRASGGTVGSVRVRWARVTVTAAAVAGWLWVGESGVAAAAAMWSALAGTVVVLAAPRSRAEVTTP